MDDLDGWVVSGGCTVAGVAPGGTVSRDALEKAGANIDALLVGGHLKAAEAAEQAEADKADGGQGAAGDAAPEGTPARARPKAASK
jgi:hypothetical protein